MTDWTPEAEARLVGPLGLTYRLELAAAVMTSEPVRIGCDCEGLACDLREDIKYVAAALHRIEELAADVLQLESELAAKNDVVSEHFHARKVAEARIEELERRLKIAVSGEGWYERYVKAEAEIEHLRDLLETSQNQAQEIAQSNAEHIKWHREAEAEVKRLKGELETRR